MKPLNRQQNVVAGIVKITLAISAVLIASSVFCFQRKGSEAGPDRWGLAAVKSYCIDDSKLSDSDRRVVDDFVKSESKPKHLLTRLHWKFVESCSEPGVDAKAMLEFVPLTRIRITNVPTTPITPSDAPDAPVWLVLTIVENSDGSPLYHTHSAPINRPAQHGAIPGEPPQPLRPEVTRDAVYHVFWAVIDYLKAVPVPPRE